MVNQPTYNPNDRSQFSAERYRNRAITDIFEPGSSIKPLIVAAALESGRVSSEQHRRHRAWLRDGRCEEN